MPSESRQAWPRRRVEELFEIHSGVTIGPARTPLKRTRGYLRVANVQRGRIDVADVMELEELPGDSERYALAEGDLLIVEGHANPGEIGRCAMVEAESEGLLHQNHLYRLRGDRMIPRLAMELLNSFPVRRYWATRTATSSGLYTINRRMLAALRLPDIPLGEQRRIVGILDSVTESELAAEASIAKLRSVRLGVVLRGMAAIEATAVPGGWERLPLKEVVPSADYGISVALNGDTSGIPTLRMNNLRDGRPDLKELRYSPQDVASRCLLRVGDVLFNRTNSIEHVGRAGIWRGELEKATFASYLIRLNPDVRRLDPRYLVEWLQHPVIRQRVRSIATVAVQQVNVNPSRLRELEIDLPVDLSDQAKLVSALDSCDQQIAAEIDNLEKIRTMKQGLAARLLGGKLAPAAA